MPGQFADLYKKLWPYVSERSEIPDAEFAVLGARFRNGRLQAGLTQRRLADLAGVSQSVVSRFERGHVRRMSAERIVRLALALGPRFPFGYCPHDHECAWPREVNARPTFWEMLNG